MNYLQNMAYYLVMLMMNNQKFIHDNMANFMHHKSCLYSGDTLTGHERLLSEIPDDAYVIDERYLQSVFDTIAEIEKAKSLNYSDDKIFIVTEYVPMDYGINIIRHEKS